MIVVSDSSPLIALACLSQLELLRILYEEITIPQAVYDEVVQAGEGRQGATAVAEASWVNVQTVQDSVAVSLLRDQLDQGKADGVNESDEGRNPEPQR